VVISVSGVGVLDKSVRLLELLTARPHSLAELVEATGWSRATTHRLACALEVHGLVRRDGDGRFTAGYRLVSFGRAAAAGVPLAGLAEPVLTALRDRTGESAQLYLAQGETRICIAAVESTHGLRTIVPLGAQLTMERGSGARVLRGELGPDGWVASVGEREPGVASVSAPVLDDAGHVVAAVSVSGPVGRTGDHPGSTYGPAVREAAHELSDRLRRG
jgi:DNA-binding IclR family transcriptional regulator